MEMDVNTAAKGEGTELELRQRRIRMADGRYMIFFTFESRQEEAAEDKEADV